MHKVHRDYKYVEQRRDVRSGGENFRHGEGGLCRS
jgi:hypothetical protein